MNKGFDYYTSLENLLHEAKWRKVRYAVTNWRFKNTPSSREMVIGAFNYSRLYGIRPRWEDTVDVGVI